MRKVFGGVTVHTELAAEWYTVSIKNEDDSIQTLHDEPFNRKKAYGVDYVIETANSVLDTPLTEEEIAWLRDVDPVELQTEILNAANKE